jgi:hypothetical protein
VELSFERGVASPRRSALEKEKGEGDLCFDGANLGWRHWRRKRAWPWSLLLPWKLVHCLGCSALFCIAANSCEEINPMACYAHKQVLAPLFGSIDLRSCLAYHNSLKVDEIVLFFCLILKNKYLP